MKLFAVLQLSNKNFQIELANSATAHRNKFHSRISRTIFQPFELHLLIKQKN